MKVQQIVYWVLGVVVVLGIFVLVEMRQSQRRCLGITVILDQQAEYPFFTENDIKNLVTDGSEVVEGILVKNLDLKGYEKRVLGNRLIKNCQASTDLAGNLVISIEQQTPLARIIHTTDSSKGGYVTETGAVVPLSSRFAARVPIVSGSFFTNFKKLKSKQGQQLVDLLKNIRDNEFWRAQIAEMIVDADGEITMIPQVGQYRIAFGLPEDVTVKFQKIKVFYKTILPFKGWNHYDLVSVKFKNQIVCE
jgi:cell division protein FtsQ